jgi:hypothetical protein
MTPGQAAKSSLSASGAFVLEVLALSSTVAGILDQADSMAEGGLRSSNRTMSSCSLPILLSPRSRSQSPRAQRSRCWPMTRSPQARCCASSTAPMLPLLPLPGSRGGGSVSLRGPAGAHQCELHHGEGELGWHFDNSPFAVTLLLRDAAKAGPSNMCRIAGARRRAMASPRWMATRAACASWLGRGASCSSRARALHG